MPRADPIKPATLTVRDVQDRYGVTAATVLTWIRAGELQAVNVSRSAKSKKPRWRITAMAIDAFEATRMPNSPRPRARRRTQPTDVIAFY